MNRREVLKVLINHFKENLFSWFILIFTNADFKTYFSLKPVPSKPLQIFKLYKWTEQFWLSYQKWVIIDKSLALNRQIIFLFTNQRLTWSRISCSLSLFNLFNIIPYNFTNIFIFIKFNFKLWQINNSILKLDYFKFYRVFRFLILESLNKELVTELKL